MNKTVSGILAIVLLVSPCAFSGESSSREQRILIVGRTIGLLDPQATSEGSDGTSRTGETIGQQLFFSTALSSKAIGRSCTSCHIEKYGWSSDLIVDNGTAHDPRTVPRLFGAASPSYLFRDGRACSLEAQAMEVIENSSEMGGSRYAIAAQVAKGTLEVGSQCSLSSKAREALSLADGQPSSSQTLTDNVLQEVDALFACVAHQLAQFERSIKAPDNVWARISLRLNSSPEALSESALSGANLFAGKGKCINCHYGPNLTDNQFHNIGVSDLSVMDISDPGRFGAKRILDIGVHNALSRKYFPDLSAGTLTRQTQEMWGSFRTPSLIGVSLSTRFMHNGKFKSLAAVVRYYNTLEGAAFPPHHYNGLLTPLHLSDQEQADLVAFLQSL